MFSRSAVILVPTVPAASAIFLQDVVLGAWKGLKRQMSVWVVPKPVPDTANYHRFPHVQSIDFAEHTDQRGKQYTQHRQNYLNKYFWAEVDK